MSSPARSSSRRSFVTWFLGTTTGALLVSVAYPIVRFLTPPEIAEATTNQLEAGPVNDPELLEKGFKIVRFGVEPVILVRLSETDFKAFAATCTHLDCIVGYQKDRERLWCNCHNGEYDLGGRNVSGPPPKPLDPYQVNLSAKSPGQPATIVISRS